MATAKENEELIVELPSDEIKLSGGSEQSAEAEPVVADAAPEAETPDEAFDSIKRNLDEALNKVSAKERETADAEARLKAEREARLKAESAVVDVTDRALVAHYHKVHGDHQFIASSIATTTRAINQAERELEQATETSNSKEIARVTRMLARLEGDLRDLENGKNASEQEVQRAQHLVQRAREDAAKAAAEPKPEPVAQPKQVSPDDWISGVRNQFGSRPADWLSQHKEFVTDPKLNQKLIKFSDYFTSVEEKPLNSPEFIAALNAKFFPQEAQVSDEGKPEARPASNGQQPQKKNVAAAPVSRGNDLFSSKNLNAQKMRLPPDVAAFVKSANLNPQLYAEGVREAIKEGKLPKEWLDDGYDRGLT